MSGIRSITRRPTIVGVATDGSAPIYVDSDDNILKIIPAGSGTTEVQQIDASSAQTLTNKTLTAPVINQATFTGGTDTDEKALAATATADANIVQATLTGFSWTLVAGATYSFDLDLDTTMTTNGGLKLTFLLTTATLTSIRYSTYQATASDNTTAVSATGTTAASGTAFVDNKTAAYTATRVRGTFVVNAGGTIAIQFAQNTSAAGADATLILIGSRARLTRIL